MDSPSYFFTIYSKTNCPFCIKAMNSILAIIGDENEDKVLVIKDPPQDVVDNLKEKYNHHTYPFIFVGDKFVGGFTDIERKASMVEEKLQKQFNFEQTF